MRIFTPFLFSAIVLSSTAFSAVEIEIFIPDSLQDILFWNQEGEFVGDMALSETPPLPRLLVLPESGVVDRQEQYRLKMTLPTGGIPKLGGVSFSFPSSFGLDQITEIEYSDNYSGKDLEIRKVYIKNNIIVLFFRWGKSPPAGTEVTFTIRSIRNPVTAGDYQVAGLIFNKWYRVEFGPTLSESFPILADVPSALTVSPDTAVTIRAGQTLYFAALAMDRFGNPINDVSLEWSLTDDSDPIGEVTSGYFIATGLGQGQIQARLESLTAISGLITVIPGLAADFEIISYPPTVRAGETFSAPVMVRAVDLFGNQVFDYDGAVYFISSDEEGEFYYNELNRYQFEIIDSGQHLFRGDNFILKSSGIQTLYCTDGSIVGTSGPITVLPGKISSFVLTGSGPVAAGERLELRIAEAVDRFGNAASGVATVRLLTNGVSPHGFPPILNDIHVIDGEGAAGQYLYRAGTNVLKAAVDSVAREYETAVLPGEPGRMDLVIPATQFLGNPILGEALLTMIDRFGNLKTDYDASVNPVIFSADHGSLLNGVLDEKDDFEMGVAKSALNEIIYDGPAGMIHIYASSGSITSNIVNLFYNGLHLAFRTSPSDTIFAGQHLDLNLSIINDGDLTPQSPAIVTSQFLSCGDLCSDSLLVLKPPLPGTDISVRLQKHTTYLMPNSEDTLQLGILSRYILNGSEYFARQHLTHRIYLLDSLLIQYVPSSLTLDSVIAPSVTPPFSLEMELNRPIDPLQYSISANYFLRRSDSTEVAISDSGQSVTVSTDGRILTLSGVYFQIPEIEEELAAGYKYISADITMRSSEGIVLRQRISDFDSLYVLPRGTVSYNRFSLLPRVIPAGETRRFEFSIELDGSTDLTLDSARSLFQLIGYDRTLEARLQGNPIVIHPGRNKITTGEIYISLELLDQQLIPRLITRGTELYITRTDTIAFNGENIFVTGLPEIKIVSTKLETVNPPFVNYGQEFRIKTTVRNLSDAPISNVTLWIVSEDGLDTLATSAGNNLNPMQDLEISLPLTAESLSVPIKIFRSAVRSPFATTIPSDDNTAAVSIQSPAEIELVYTLSGVYEGYVDFGENFVVAARLRNLGEAGALPGEITLSTGGVDFGIPDPSTQTIEIGGIANFNMIAPSFSVSTNLQLSLTTIPIDRNTGLPAKVKVGSAVIPIRVEPGDAELAVSGQVLEGPLVIEGSSPILFELKLRNNTDNPLNVVGLLAIELMFTDNRDNLLEPGAILIPESTAFLSNGAAVAYGETDGGYIQFRFENFLMHTQEEKLLRFKARLRDEIEVNGFGLRLENRDISAVFASGPRINQPVPVRGEFDSSFRLSGNFIIAPPSLGHSLMARNNPFNPNRESAEIAYSLAADETVTMTVFTLSGEKVYEKVFAAGSEGGRQGVNYVTWDGRNDNGKIVLNGVYVVVFREGTSGQSHKLKMAVLK